MSSFYSYFCIFHFRPLGKNNYFAKQSLQMSVSSLIQQRVWKPDSGGWCIAKIKIVSVQAATVREAFWNIAFKENCVGKNKDIEQMTKILTKSSKTHISERYHKTQSNIRIWVSLRRSAFPWWGWVGEERHIALLYSFSSITSFWGPLSKVSGRHEKEQSPLSAILITLNLKKILESPS